MFSGLFTIVLMVLFIGIVFILPVYEFFVVKDREAAASDSHEARKSRILLTGIIVALAASCLAYKILVAHHLEQTSALFIGLPALLAILVVLFAKPKTATGMLCMATLTALLMSGIFLGEGFVCILMASPIFFGIAILVGLVIDNARRKKKSETTMTCLLVLALAPMSLEGVTPTLSFPREETVVVENVVPASAAQVLLQLSSIPTFSAPLPAYLRVGFPRPIEASGQGIAVGDRRVIRFGGGEGKPGDLVLAVSESNANRVVFQAKSDTSHIAHWLTWRSAEVEWQETGSDQTRVRWTLRYRRSLDPAWYFGPWERYAARLSGDYLAETVTTPTVH